ncbi:two-component sensor histidine kinase [Lentibacter algarum]|uniref:ATP-binding protein n=1 Tax=Lentibacter algarum TaxID=576131 RepID=UPI001C06A94C|nr:ATP-binding protein [Lentibacter algarum]MBU2982353.1 two-component sensor histidine kinase [Lentibacter algarum]
MPFKVYQPLLDAMSNPAVLIGQDARISAANAPAQTLFGAPLVGAHYVTVMRQPELVEALGACFEGKPACSVQVRQSRAEGDSIFQANCAIVAGENPPLVLLTFEDISQLESAGAQRRDFVANVSHELRTPLTALMGFIETLRGPARDDAAARKRFLDIMAGEAARMEGLVADLLSLSRVEGQERQRPRDKVDLGAVIAAAVSTLAGATKAANVTVTCNLPSTGLTLTGDGEQLRQLVTNLIENAIKYGGQGKTVTISASQSEHIAALRGPAITLSVQDQGTGIDALHIPRLTERFYRVDDHRSREVGGTGLGLAIVKHIVNRHRGRLEISSKEGQGSLFTVTLPL